MTLIFGPPPWSSRSLAAATRFRSGTLRMWRAWGSLAMLHASLSGCAAETSPDAVPECDADVYLATCCDALDPGAHPDVCACTGTPDNPTCTRGAVVCACRNGAQCGGPIGSARCR